MSITGLDTFDRTIQEANIWLKDIMEKQNLQDKRKAYVALRSVLHILRDRLPVDEAAQLGAELPMLIRGVYYEGWKPSQKPLRKTEKEVFSQICDDFQGQPEIDPEEVFKNVLSVMTSHVSKGEMEDVRANFPKRMRELLAA